MFFWCRVFLSFLSVDYSKGYSCFLVSGFFVEFCFFWVGVVTGFFCFRYSG